MEMLHRNHAPVLGSEQQVVKLAIVLDLEQSALKEWGKGGGAAENER